MSQGSGNDEQRNSQSGDPVGDLEYLRRRIGEERSKGEKKLVTLGKIEAQVNWSIAAYRLADRAEIGLDEERWPGITTVTSGWRSRFDRDFPRSDDPSDLLHPHLLSNTTCGSATYTMVIESVNHFEEPDTYQEYERVKDGFETLWENESRTDEVARRLAWLSEDAAAKFKAAWDALDAGIPFTDPASGPALLMRSALDLTVVKALLKRTREPHPKSKSEYLEHIALHAGRSAEAEKLLASQARVYPDLTNKLSKVKGTAQLERNTLRTLFFRSQELLYLIVESIDPSRLLPKKRK